MSSRRQFLTSLGAFAAGGFTFRPNALSQLLADFPSSSADPLQAAQDEKFWDQIAGVFKIDRSYINLNAGGVSPTSEPALQESFAQQRYAQGLPSRWMWSEQIKELDGIRKQLAGDWGVSPEEMALTRNASEGLHICQNGIDLARGDEVITTTMDYPRMINAWKQREQRDGIILKQVQMPVPCESESECVDIFEKEISAKTKLIHVCHVINLNGQIMPVRKISEMAHRHGVRVIVDGAHSFAHFPFKLDELGCDFFATSLHKWLAAPIGTGLLWMKQEHIHTTWPLMAAAPGQRDDVRKFEEIGTNPVALKLGILPALELHRRIGGKRKVARLRFLRDRWIDSLSSLSDFYLRTSRAPEFSAGIATFAIDGVKPIEIFKPLFNHYKILTAPIKHSETSGIRVSPSVYTTLDEIDRFTAAVKSILS